MASATTFFIGALRPAIIHILRAAGFHGARASAADTLTDIAWRYILLIAEKAAENARDHDLLAPSITNVRMALEDVDALTPEISAAEEQMFFDDDLRGLQTLSAWLDSELHKEIRRIAGLEVTAEEARLNVDELITKEDYLTALKKKHNKTGEESRFQGTALGKPAADRSIKIDGNEGVATIAAWHTIHHKRKLAEIEEIKMDLMHNISAESSPLSDV